MVNPIRKYLTLCVAVISISVSHAQPQSDLQDSLLWNKNAIYGTVGWFTIYGAVNGSYERIIAESDQGFLRTYWIKAAYGGYSTWGSSGPTFFGGFTALSGQRNNHLELSLGITSLFDRTSYDIGVSNAHHAFEETPSKSAYRMILPAGGIGYRYQKPTGYFIFRTGIGFPEALFVGAGFCF